MNNRKFNLIVLLISCWLFYGCSTARRLPAGEKLYTGSIVTVSGPSLSINERKVLRADLKGLTRPKANSQFLGLRIKLSIYNMFRNKKASSFWGKLRDKYGEPPVLFSQVDIEKNTKILQNHLENKGYFKAKVTGDSIIRRHLARTKYKAVTGEQYSITSIHFPTDSSDLSQEIAKSSDKTLLKTGEPFDLDLIKAERLRIDDFGFRFLIHIFCCM